MDGAFKRELDRLDRENERQWEAIGELKAQLGIRPAASDHGTTWRVIGAVGTLLGAAGLFLAPIITALTASP